MFAIFVVLLFVAAWGAGSPHVGGVDQPARQPSPAAVEDLFLRYSESIGSDDPIALPAVDLDLARNRIARVASAAPGEDGASSERQRRLLVTFALELAAAGAARDAEAATRLVEWGCDQVRAVQKPGDFERAWQRAALSVIEGGINPRLLLQHVNHTQPRLRDEPRLVLARAIIEEQSFAPAEVKDGPTPRVPAAQLVTVLAKAEVERKRTAERAISAYRDAAREPAVNAEARLRLGHVQLRLHRYQDALDTWNGLGKDTDDVSLLYLLALFRGLAHEGLDNPEEAKAAYLTALRISPGAHSAAVRLAALAYRTGTGDPRPFLHTALRESDPRMDPWWSYYTADWRLWRPHISRVRALLR